MANTSSLHAPSHLHLWMPQNAPKSPPAALCLAGQLRVLSYTWMQDNLREAVITPLRAAVFMHVSRQSRACGKRGQSWLSGKYIPCSSGAGLLSRADLDILIERLTPTSLALLDDSVLLKKREFRASLEPGVHKEMPVGCRGSTCLPLLLRYAGCADDIERFESEQSHRFQLVVRARPDLLWHCRLPEAPPLVDRGGTFTYRDWFSVFSRDVALNALRLQERIAQPQPCQTRSPVHEQLICMDSVLAERKANWCELGRWHSHNGQHLRPTKSDEQSADAPVEIQRETLSGLPKGGGRAVPPQKTCRLCRPESPATDSKPTTDDAHVHCDVRRQMLTRGKGGGGPCPGDADDDDR